MDIQSYLMYFIDFIDFVLIPFLFALALLFFLFNATRYFIISAAEDEARKKAKQLALYGILAFVFLVSLWGIVNLIVYSFWFDREGAVAPDYFTEYGGPDFYQQPDSWSSWDPTKDAWQQNGNAAPVSYPESQTWDYNRDGWQQQNKTEKTYPEAENWDYNRDGWQQQNTGGTPATQNSNSNTETYYRNDVEMEMTPQEMYSNQRDYYDI